MNKKSNIIMGIVLVGVGLLSIGWFALSPGKKSSPELSGQSAAVAEAGSVQTSEAQSESADGLTGQSGGAGPYVASKNGSKYFPEGCGSAKTIKEENKISFSTPEEAEKAGYTPAKNCGN